MRESELVSKIIKEWEALPLTEKEELFRTYVTEKHISEDKSESSGENKGKRPSPGSSKSKKKKAQSSSKPVAGSSGTPSKKGVRVFIQSSSSKKEKEQSESSDFARDGVKKDFQISESDSKEIGGKVGKKKRITKQDRQPRTEYLKFFKFYYEKLSAEHKRWTANQISTIIKLLWKKKLTTDKTASRSIRAPVSRRKISGRMAFRRAYNYTGIEVVERWRQLPVESKKYWMGKGEGLRSGEKRRLGGSINSVHFKRQQRKQSGDSNFGYLRRSIGA
jgi:hypothetical protein